MKKYFALFVISLFTLTSCSSDGEVGPRGPQGPPGEPGADGLIATVYETEALNFTADNGYSEIVDIPSNIEIFDSDVILVYLLEGVDEETNADIWTLLPQIFYLDDGELVYNYNYTSDNVAIFLDGNAQLENLDAVYTENQIFRIVVVPAGFPTESAVDVSNYNAVMSALNIKEENIPTLEIRK